MILTSAELWAAATNCYVIAPERGGSAVIVDAPPDVDAIVRLLAANDLVPVALLVTHGHVDHSGGAAGVTTRMGVSAYLHPDDDYLVSDPATQVRSIFGFVPPGIEEFAPPDHYVDLAHGDRLNLAGFDFEVRHTPGHTLGHCAFVVEDARDRLAHRRGGVIGGFHRRPTLCGRGRPDRPAGWRFRHAHGLDAHPGDDPSGRHTSPPRSRT